MNYVSAIESLEAANPDTQDSRISVDDAWSSFLREIASPKESANHQRFVRQRFAKWRFGRNTTIALVVGVILTGSAAASGVLSSASPTNLGTVSGTFTLVAGVDITPHPIDGTVSLTRQHQNGSVKVAVSDAGKFTVHLPPGKWFVSGRSPKFTINNHQASCGPNKPIKVAADKTTYVKVQCVGK